MKTLKELLPLVGPIAKCEDQKLLDQLYFAICEVIDPYSEKLYELYGHIDIDKMAPVHGKKLENYYRIRLAIRTRLYQLEIENEDKQ